LRIATNHYRKNKTTGENETMTTWHRCVVYGEQAEFVCDKAKKGDALFVEGLPVDRSWDDKLKGKITIREMNVNTVKFPAGFSQDSDSNATAVMSEDQIDAQIYKQQQKHEEWLKQYDGEAS